MERLVAPRVATVAAIPKTRVPRGALEMRLMAVWVTGLALSWVATRSPVVSTPLSSRWNGRVSRDWRARSPTGTATIALAAVRRLAVTRRS